MARRTIFACVTVGIFATLGALWSSRSEPVEQVTVSGKNNTVLFLTTEHPGCCNVHLATAYALAVRYPYVKVDYASLPINGPRVERLTTTAKAVAPSSRGIAFHPLAGIGYVDALAKTGLSIDPRALMTTPDVKGLARLCGNMQHYISPWPAEDHYETYLNITRVISELDPAVIVLDMVFGPAVDAVRDQNRTHVILTPNLFASMVPSVQPPHKILWKWPALGSGFPFPVPWKHIPANFYMSLYLISSLLRMPNVRAKQAWLKAKGLRNPIDFVGLYRQDVLWLTQTLPGAHDPMDVMPANLIRTGPINLARAEGASVEGMELMQWIRQAPTVLINLGSGFTYLEIDARMMLQAVKEILLESDVQILWKMKQSRKQMEWFDAAFIAEAVKNSGGRLRVETWLEVEPPTLLQSGHVAAFVHHGGAGSFHDALGGGVPQIIIPMWVDLYNFAQLVEDLGIGMWACRGTSPGWTVEGIKSGILAVLRDGSMKENAADYGELARKNPRRDVAALEVANLAALGY